MHHVLKMLFDAVISISVIQLSAFVDTKSTQRKFGLRWIRWIPLEVISHIALNCP